MAKFLGNKSTSLLRLVEERALSKKEKEEEEKEKKKKVENQVPYLPKDCISNILVRLPIESLQRSSFVCKPWFNIINSSLFIDAHLSRSETVLIFLRSIPEKRPNTFSVEGNVIQSKSFSMFQRSVFDHRDKFYIQFMEIKDGKSKIRDLNACCLGKIKASCNGLVLLQNQLKQGGLIVINPVTRQMVELPLGTIFPPHNESFGFALSPSRVVYKVVHLFRDELGFVGCEILNLGTRSWRVVNGPPHRLFSWFGYDPVSAIGALHWVPHIDDNEYIVSFGLDDEKFHRKSLPASCRRHDRLVEMRGILCYINHVESSQMDVWILKDLCGEYWIKHQSITVGYILDMVPLSISRNGEVTIFRRDEDNSLYAYDTVLEQMTRVEILKGCFPSYGAYLPHVNSLVSWRSSRDQWQEDLQ